MRSVTRTTRYPAPLDSRAAIRAKELGYSSVSEYRVALELYDMAVRQPHSFTADFAKLPRAEQDRIVDEIARAFDSGESLGGSWMKHCIDAAVQDLSKKPEENKLMRTVISNITKRKTS